MNEYWTELRDGQMIAYPCRTVDPMELQKGLAPAVGENPYDYRLRVLRTLTGRDIVSWTMGSSEMLPPVVYQPSRRILFGCWCFALAAIGSLLLGLMNSCSN